MLVGSPQDQSLSQRASLSGSPSRVSINTTTVSSPTRWPKPINAIRRTRRAAGRGFSKPPQARRPAFFPSVNKVTDGRSHPIAGPRPITKMGGNAVNRPRAADDFAAIRARMEELRREREGAQAPESEIQSDRPMRSARVGHWSQREISAGPRQVRQPGPIRSLD